MLWYLLALPFVLLGLYVARKHVIAPSKKKLEQEIYGGELARPIREHGGLRHETMAWDGVGRSEDGKATLSYFRTGPDEGGEGERPTLVFLHPTPHTLLSFVGTWFGDEGLARDHEVLALEVLGHGVARPDVGLIGFQDCADWVSAALRHLGVEDAILIGQSYGGEVAWRAALDSIERVRGVVLMDSSGLARREGDWLPEEKAMRSMKLATIGWMLNSRDRVEGALALHYETQPPHQEQVTAVARTCDNPSNWRAMVGLCRDENGERFEELADLDRPTLLLWGELDKAYEPSHYGEAFLQKLPDAELELVPGSGHYPQEEQPALVARAIRAFVARRLAN